MDRQLPAGEFVFVQNMENGVTPEELSAYLVECGLDIPPERISIRKGNFRSCAIISLYRDTVVSLLNWATSERPFNGLQLEFKVPIGTKNAKAS